jgi:hypothetical protein
VCVCVLCVVLRDVCCVCNGLCSCVLGVVIFCGLLFAVCCVLCVLCCCGDIYGGRLGRCLLYLFAETSKRKVKGGGMSPSTFAETSKAKVEVHRAARPSKQGLEKHTTVSWSKLRPLL